MDDIKNEIVKAMIEDRFKGKITEEFFGNSGRIFIVDHGENCYPRLIAVKTVKQKNQHSINLFLNECKNWSKANSAFVATAFYIERIGGNDFLCLKACKYSLFEFMKNIEVSDFGKLYISLQLCLGLQEINSFGIGHHQDLNPQNILIVDLSESHQNFPSKDSDDAFRYKVQIADFGMANYFLDDPIEGAKGGKFPYKAPEQYLGNQLDGKFNPDIFSLGIIMHMLLTGFHPCGLENGLILKRNPNKPKDGWEMWSKSVKKPMSILGKKFGELENILDDCLVIDPDKRPKIEELISIIKNLLKKIDHNQYEYMMTLTQFFQNAFFKSLRNELKIYT